MNLQQLENQQVIVRSSQDSSFSFRLAGTLKFSQDYGYVVDSDDRQSYFYINDKSVVEITSGKTIIVRVS